MSRPKTKLQLPTLDSGPISLAGIRDQARRQLIDLIDLKRGKKALILDPSCSGPITLLDGSLSELLAEHGVCKLQYLEAKPLDDPSYNSGDVQLVDVKNIVYIVRATLQNAQLVANHVRGARTRPGAHDFSVYFVPRRTIACDKVLEDEGVYGDIQLGEYALELLPCEEDVLSLEMEYAFRDCVVDGDSSSLFYVARAIMRLQSMFGLIPRLQGKGPAAVAVRDMALRMRRENPMITAAVGCSRIDRAILIDREVDILTPMMTQITFEGLIDEFTGIKNSAVPWVPKDRKSAEAGGEFARSVKGSTLLNSTDPFYREFRDLPYHIAIQRLQHYARDARREYTELGNKDLSELKTFVKGLPKLMMLDRLSDIATPVAEQVKQQLFHDRLKHEQDIVEGYDLEASVAFIEELMCRGSDVFEVLRLMVLLNECNQGIPKRHMDALRTELLQTYGHEHLLTIMSLERAGFLRVSTTAKSSFKEVRKLLKLVVSDEEPLPHQKPVAGPSGSTPAQTPAQQATPNFNPTDVSFLYKGYAPLSIRLVETALRSHSWNPVSEVLSLLPGSHFDTVQSVDANGLPVDKPYKAGLHMGGAQQQASWRGSGETGAADTHAATAAHAPSAAAAATASTSAGPSGVGGQGGASPSGLPKLPSAVHGSLAGGGGGGPSVGSETGHTSPSSSEVVLVVFIGGVTYSEISALRWMSSRPEFPHKFLILTTKIINGRTLLQSFVDPVTNSCLQCPPGLKL